MFAWADNYDVQATRSEAKAEGHVEGHAEGFSEGMEAGETKGKAEGKEEALKEVIPKLKALGMSAEDIAKVTSLKVNETANYYEV